MTALNPGYILLIITLVISVVILFFLARSASGNMLAQMTSERLYYLTSMLILFSLILLLTYFIFHRYDILYVFDNSSNDLSFSYLVAALWAGKEGSFLLWLLMLNICGIAVIWADDEYKNVVMSIILITQIFLLIVLVIESPFAFIWDKYPAHFKPGMIPVDGAGMNPLLIDPWMVIHPPVLFIGYATATIPFGYAVAGLIKGDPRKWLEFSFPWVLFSVLFLGLGIFLGGYWSYTVLGWGGFWGWDPVENASLIPWLVGAALMHGMLLQKRSNILPRANVGMALFYFILVFLSTFLTRSGVLTNFSVHSFGESKISVYLLTFIIFYVIIALFLFIKRFKAMAEQEPEESAMDWRAFTIFGIITLGLYSFIILFGTTLPILSSAVVKHPTAPGPNYYNNLSILFGPLILILMAIATSLLSKEKLLSVRRIIAVFASIILGVLFNIAFTRSPAAYMLTIISLYVIIYSVIDLYNLKTTTALASRLAHIGVAVMVIGVVASGYFSTTATKSIQKGKEYNAGDFTLTFKGEDSKGKGGLRFSMEKGGTVSNFTTAYYFDSRTNSLYREPHISCGLSGDIYITPDNYQSGMYLVTTGTLHKNDEKEIGGVKIKFTQFITKHMTSESPSIYAELIINGKSVKPGFSIMKGERINLPQKVPGTDRDILLLDIDAGEKAVILQVAPGKNTIVPPDTVIVDIAHKRLIWIVWLGTLIISAGLVFAFYRSVKKRG